MASCTPEQLGTEGSFLFYREQERSTRQWSHHNPIKFAFVAVSPVLGDITNRSYTFWVSLVVIARITYTMQPIITMRTSPGTLSSQLLTSRAVLDE
jgi:hypothetical protein